MIELVRRIGIKPFFCVWELTLACNLRCKHCGSLAGEPRADELRLDEALPVADQLAALGTLRVTLGGGEPTLHPHWHVIGRRLSELGVAVNIIPDAATFSGTARTLTEANRRKIRAAIERRCAGAAAGADCRLEFQWSQGYPAVNNDPAMADFVAEVARSTLGPDRFIPVAKPSMGGEDFSYYLEKVPGCIFLIGVEPADRNGYPVLHSDQYDFTDDALAVAIGMLVELAARFRA